MSKNDLFNDMSIDSILNDVKQLTGEQTAPERIWSLDEIDALLSDDDTVKEETVDTPVENVTEAPKEQKKPEPVEEKTPVQEEKNVDKAVDKAKENRKIEKTSTLGLKEFAMKNAIETGAIKTRIENESTESLLEEFEEKLTEKRSRRTTLKPKKKFPVR